MHLASRDATHLLTSRASSNSAFVIIAGEAESCLQELYDISKREGNEKQRSIALVNKAKRRNSSANKSSGLLFVDSMEVERHHTFLEYIRGGAEVI